MNVLFQVVGVGLISGLVSPLIVSFLQHKVIWRSQKRLEFKYQVFADAVKALSQWETDALDLKIQAEKPVYQSGDNTSQLRRKVEARSETWVLLNRSRSIVQAFFSEVVAEKFSKAMRAPIGIEEAPCGEFITARTEAILALVTELKIK